MKQPFVTAKDYWEKLPEWLRQLFGFGVVGAVNIAVQYGIYYFFLYLQLVNNEFYYTFCNLISIFATWLVSYTLYSLFVFKPKKSPDQQESDMLRNQFGARRTMRMIITNGSYLILSSILIVFFVETCHIPEKIASLVCIGVLIPYNFLMTKLWVYKDVANSK